MRRPKGCKCKVPGTCAMKKMLGKRMKKSGRGLLGSLQGLVNSIGKLGRVGHGITTIRHRKEGRGLHGVKTIRYRKEGQGLHVGRGSTIEAQRGPANYPGVIMGDNPGTHTPTQFMPKPFTPYIGAFPMRKHDESFEDWLKKPGALR